MNVSAKMPSQRTWLKLWKDYDPGWKKKPNHTQDLEGETLVCSLSLNIT